MRVFYSINVPLSYAFLYTVEHSHPRASRQIYTLVYRVCTLVMVRIVIFNIYEYECKCEYFILIFANANANITL